LTYQYTYDDFDRKLTKKIPDREIELFAYDDRDLLIGVGRSGLPNSALSVAIQYDGFGRILKEGLSSSVLPTNGTPNTITSNNLLASTSYGSAAAEWGKITLSEQRILTETGLEGLLSSRFYYDSYGRLENTNSNHHRDINNSTALRTELRYDLADNLLRSKNIINFPQNDPLEIIEETKIDVSGRMTDAYHQTIVDGAEGPKIHTSKTNYTPKDQVNSTSLGIASSGGALVTCSYNYRGNSFLESMSADLPNSTQNLFNLSLYYDQSLSYAGYQSQLNGNISAQKITAPSGEDYILTYEYDGLDRLRASTYIDNANSQNNGRFNTAYTYDERGNIKTLSRFGAQNNNGAITYGQIDDLAYNYVNNSSNKLSSVTDAITTNEGEAGFHQIGSTSNYTYDARGNLEVNPGNGTTTNYNYLGGVSNVRIGV